MGVDTPMTGRMQQDSVLYGVWATLTAPDDVVDVPSRFVGEWLVADGTETVLRIPVRHELTLSLEFGGHRPAQALFEVDFPGRVVRIGVSA